MYDSLKDKKVDDDLLEDGKGGDMHDGYEGDPRPFIWDSVETISYYESWSWFTVVGIQQ